MTTLRAVKLLACAALSAAGALCPQAGAAAADGPRFAVKPEKLDFGLQPTSARLTGAFVLKNVGAKTLEIKTDEASCGCVMDEIGDIVLQPGQQMELSFTVDTSESGDGSIQLTTNDPARPKVALPFYVTVLRDVSIDESTLRYGATAQGETKTVKAAVWSVEPGDKVRVRSLTSTLANVTLSQRYLSEPEREGVEIAATINTAGMPLGRFAGTIRVELDRYKNQTFTMELEGRITGGIVPTPNPLSIIAAKESLPLPHARIVTLRSPLGKPFRILRVKSSAPYLTVSADGSTPANHHRIEINLTQETPETRKGAARHTVEVFTDATAEPCVEEVYLRITGRRPGAPAAGPRPYAVYAGVGALALAAAAAAVFVRRSRA